MRLRFLTLLCGLTALPLTAGAQGIAGSSRYGMRPGEATIFELGLQYQAPHVNAPPSSCGCFWMEGGGVQAVFNVRPRLGIVADLSGANATNINGVNQRLSTFNYVFGPRIWLRSRHVYKPYAEAMAGGSEVFSNYVVYGGGRSSFAAMGGGGVELRLSHHFSVVPIEADYIYTRAENGVNQEQNTLRIAAGINLRLGGR